jgi:alkylated DNA repair dioxygenase AlkB
MGGGPLEPRGWSTARRERVNGTRAGPPALGVPRLSVREGLDLAGIARELSWGAATMRIALREGAWLDHEPGWLDTGEADRLLVSLQAELTWEQRAVLLFGRRVLQPRLIAWAGWFGYRYSGQTLEPRPFTPSVAELIKRVRQRARVPLNHVLVNRYRDGLDSMGLHADDEPELGADPVVASVSLGAVRRLIVRPRRPRLGAPLHLDLGHGALLVMGGTCQRHYVHGVPRQPAIPGERISLTFRWIQRPP